MPNFTLLTRQYDHDPAKRREIGLAYVQLIYIFRLNRQLTPPDIVYYVAANQLEEVKKRLEKNQKLIYVREESRNYPLVYVAARAGYDKMVELLLKYDKIRDDSKDYSTPLKAAAYYGHADAVRTLLQHGINK